VPRVPVLHQATTRPGLQASHYTTNLAFRLLGARHDWASSTASGGFNRVLVAIDKFTKWIEVKTVTCPKADRNSTSWMSSCIATDYPTASSHTWVPTETITSSGSTARTTGSTSGMFQSPILGPMDKSNAPTGWYSTLSRSDCTTQLTQKGASETRNYLMHSGGSVHNLLMQQGSHLISWSTAPKLFYLPT
jgi:hypothetical protein